MTWHTKALTCLLSQRGQWHDSFQRPVSCSLKDLESDSCTLQECLLVLVGPTPSTEWSQLFLQRHGLGDHLMRQSCYSQHVFGIHALQG